jgi:hypothetical protein
MIHIKFKNGDELQMSTSIGVAIVCLVAIIIIAIIA